jgi:hypothetical protein
MNLLAIRAWLLDIENHYNIVMRRYGVFAERIGAVITWHMALTCRS